MTEPTKRDVDVIIRDVSLRDGLQDEAPISSADKLAVFEALVGAGVRELELTSFVRPDRVPAMADAEEIARETAGRAGDGPTRWGLVLNERGAQRASAAGIRHLQFVVSASSTHQHHNAGRSVDAALEELARLREVADPVAVEVTVATAFGCPYEGPVDPAAVLRVVEAAVEAGVDGLSLADTIGTAVPREVRDLVGAARRAADRPVGVHLHDTRGTALANAFEALEAGATRLDASIGGLGGCPFAPGASGNLPTEDLVHALEASNVRTGIDLDALLAAARMICAAVGRPLASHVGQAGPRYQREIG